MGNSLLPKTKMAGEVLVDALPYYDQGYDEPGVREAVRIMHRYYSLYFHFGHV